MYRKSKNGVEAEKLSKKDGRRKSHRSLRVNDQFLQACRCVSRCLSAFFLVTLWLCHIYTRLFLYVSCPISTLFRPKTVHRHSSFVWIPCLPFFLSFQPRKKTYTHSVRPFPWAMSNLSDLRKTCKMVNRSGVSAPWKKRFEQPACCKTFSTSKAIFWCMKNWLSFPFQVINTIWTK